MKNNQVFGKKETKNEILKIYIYILNVYALNIPEIESNVTSFHEVSF